ncbi:uncharacterized protein CLUP02_16492 [Colletotrichum lupini]|uniref:Uncharacterized protein n=1 Tax=Colletotrichum lupini TaxID=145971 RepID=A0A9Q8T8J3_9PEZI|nr:uncharacterized protein CLUP02_16492 [Colletotrichum lupini]UQC90960.1 hypothetical protein CLUP02_16492 [Colletotrichum lupini]
MSFQVKLQTTFINWVYHFRLRRGSMFVLLLLLTISAFKGFLTVSQYFSRVHTFAYSGVTWRRCTNNGKNNISWIPIDNTNAHVPITKKPERQQSSPDVIAAVAGPVLQFHERIDTDKNNPYDADVFEAFDRERRTHHEDTRRTPRKPSHQQSDGELIDAYAAPTRAAASSGTTAMRRAKFAVPVAVGVLELGRFLADVVFTRQMPLLKDSLIVLLFYPLSGWEGDEIYVEGAPSSEELEKLAESLHGRLETEDARYRVIKHDNTAKGESKGDFSRGEQRGAAGSVNLASQSSATIIPSWTILGLRDNFLMKPEGLGRMPRKNRSKRQKHTTPGIRWSSPTQLLIRPSLAYLWESGRDPEFSNRYGRMCQSAHAKLIIFTDSCIQASGSKSLENGEDATLGSQRQRSGPAKAECHHQWFDKPWMGLFQGQDLQTMKDVHVRAE